LKIQLDFNHSEWQQFGDNIPEDSYRIIEEYWEDSDEWAIVEVTDSKWQQWIRLHHADWIVD
jgi:hypothetical protein